MRKELFAFQFMRIRLVSLDPLDVSIVLLVNGQCVRWLSVTVPLMVTASDNTGNSQKKFRMPNFHCKSNGFAKQLKLSTISSSWTHLNVFIFHHP